MTDLREITPASAAPYAARFVTDTHAIEYRYWFAKQVYLVRITKRIGNDWVWVTDEPTDLHSASQINIEHAAKMLQKEI